MNGCWNRKPLETNLIVQTGWHYLGASRTAVLERIKDPMTKTCMYQILHKNDPKCAECKHLEKI